MKTLFGYPLTLTASVRVRDEEVDISAAFKFDAHSETGLRLDVDEALALIGVAQKLQERDAFARSLAEAVRKSPCHPDNGGIAGIKPGGLRSWCSTCGASFLPHAGCDLERCPHRPLAGATDGVGWPD
jgi:hypothetical protein